MHALITLMKFPEYAAQYPDFIFEVRAAKQRAEYLLAQLADRRLTRDRRRILLRRILLGDYGTRLFYSYEGVRRAGRLGQNDPASIRRMASEMNVYAPLYEPVETHVISTGRKNRRIFSFRPRSRARQLLVAATIKAMHAPFRNQFTVTGGVPKALDAVEEAVSKGFVFGRELDIQDFYPSIPLEQLITSLQPLPRVVIENSIWMGNAVPLVSPDGSLYGVDTHDLLPVRGLRGLPQGSACSAIAAEKIVADVVAALPMGICFVTYADNIMLLGENPNDVEQATNILVQELHTRSAGSLTLKVPIQPISDFKTESISFLGNEGSLEHRGEKLIVNWIPEFSSFERFAEILEDVRIDVAEIRREIRRVAHWPRAYPRWLGREEWRVTALAQLKAKLAYLCGDMERGQLATEIAVHYRELNYEGDVIELLPETEVRSAEKRLRLQEMISHRLANSLPHKSRTTLNRRG